MHFAPVPGATSPPIFIPVVALGTDQAGLIPNIGDLLTDSNNNVHKVVSRNFTYTTASVSVLITCTETV